MACYTPLSAYRSKDGISFHQNDDESLYEIKLPCGQCIGCRLEYARQWAVRITHEASLHENNCFLTLTYDENHLPENNSLVKEDPRSFLKRLRQWQYRQNEKLQGQKYGKLGFYLCGEYGENFSRPHYHACLFNFDFPDKVRIEDSKSGHQQFTSKILDLNWGMGRATISALSSESAAYCAGYVTKKIRGRAASDYYGNRLPEYSACSRRPAIGLKWVEKFHTDIYNYDTCMVNGKTQRPPRYYDKFYQKNFPEKYDETVMKREVNALLNSNSDEYSMARLNVKHKVQLEKQKNIKRTFENNTNLNQSLTPVESYDKKVIHYRDGQLRPDLQEIL